MLDNKRKMCYNQLVMCEENNKTDMVLQMMDSTLIEKFIEYKDIFRNLSSLDDDESFRMSIECVRSASSKQEQKFILDNIFESKHCVLYSIESTYKDCLTFIKDLYIDEPDSLIIRILDDYTKLYHEVDYLNKSKSFRLSYAFNHLSVKDEMSNYVVRYISIFKDDTIYLLEYCVADKD